MRYISTRGLDTDRSFEDVLLNGLARDGGLYLPKTWPHLSADEIRSMSSKSYAEIAGMIIGRFTGGYPEQSQITAMAEDAYKGFSHRDVAPLVTLDNNLHVCELFHGPTIAFKDYAMQFLSRAFDDVLTKTGKRAVILGATSGDTGSAALEAFKGRESVDVFILFPEGRVSPVQQKQMTSVLDAGAHAVAVKGTFDDCQDLVKASFNDASFRDAVNLSAVNSINWARLVPQIVYYFTAAVALGAPDKPVAFSVPTGNFGNVFAGWAALQMGLPIEKLIVASNRNDILTRFFETGQMVRDDVAPSLSPSMDIQASSNFERLLFELLERDGDNVRALMQGFSETGRFDVSADVLTRALETFSGFRLDDEGTRAEITRTAAETGMVIDPHSAVGLSAARAARATRLVADDIPIISLACAHPAKFPDAVKSVTGAHPALPNHMADLMEREERLSVIENDISDVQAFVKAGMRS